MSSRWVWLSQYLSTHRCHSVLLHSVCWTSLHKAVHHLCRKGVGMRSNMWAKESISRLLKPTIISVYKHIHKTSLSFTWSESIPLQMASGLSVLLCGEKNLNQTKPTYKGAICRGKEVKKRQQNIWDPLLTARLLCCFRVQDQLFIACQKKRRHQGNFMWFLDTWLPSWTSRAAQVSISSCVMSRYALKIPQILQDI